MEIGIDNFVAADPAVEPAQQMQNVLAQIARVAVEMDGRFVPSESATDQRNPSLCDIFFEMSAMERAGARPIDVADLMAGCGGCSAFYHYSREFCPQKAHFVESMEFGEAVFAVQGASGQVSAIRWVLRSMTMAITATLKCLNRFWSML